MHDLLGVILDFARLWLFRLQGASSALLSAADLVGAMYGPSPAYEVVVPDAWPAGFDDTYDAATRRSSAYPSDVLMSEWHEFARCCLERQFHGFRDLLVSPLCRYLGSVYRRLSTIGADSDLPQLAGCLRLEVSAAALELRRLSFAGLGGDPELVCLLSSGELAKFPVVREAVSVVQLFVR